MWHLILALLLCREWVNQTIVSSWHLVPCTSLLYRRLQEYFSVSNGVSLSDLLCVMCSFNLAPFTQRQKQIFPRVLTSHLHKNPVFNQRKRLFLAKVEVSDTTGYVLSCQPGETGFWVLGFGFECPEKRDINSINYN